MGGPSLTDLRCRSCSCSINRWRHRRRWTLSELDSAASVTDWLSSLLHNTTHVTTNPLVLSVHLSVRSVLHHRSVCVKFGRGLTNGIHHPGGRDVMPALTDATTYSENDRPSGWLVAHDDGVTVADIDFEVLVERSNRASNVENATSGIVGPARM